MDGAPSTWTIIEGLVAALAGVVSWIARTTTNRVEREQYSMKNDIRTNSEAVAGLLAKDEQYKLLSNIVSTHNTQIATLSADMSGIKVSLSRIENRLDRILENNPGHAR